MKDFVLLDRKPTAAELIELRKSVGWDVLEEEAHKRGLKKSLFGVCAVVKSQIVGTARVVGDGITCFYVQDVIVRPEYQKSGVGKCIMNRIMGFIGENACKGAVIGLMSAKGKEVFYEKFGFWTRPNENYGCGMIQIWNKE